MNTTALKVSLLDKLVSIEDDAVLQKIEKIIGKIDIEASSLKLTKAQKHMLHESEEDISNGNVMNDDDVNNEEDKWLNE